MNRLHQLKILMDGLELLEQMKQAPRGYIGSLADYGRQIRNAVTAYWRGDTDEDLFVDTMIRAIERGITRAFREGAVRCGISPDEFTETETEVLEKWIVDTWSPVLDFADQIEAGSRKNGGKLQPLLYRAEMWTNRYNAAMAEAQALACGDKKQEWRMNPMKEHCDDCLNMNGRVYRLSIWKKYGILPQSRSLACGGWRCGCGLYDTEHPITPGRPPALVGG